MIALILDPGLLFFLIVVLYFGAFALGCEMQKAKNRICNGQREKAFQDEKKGLNQCIDQLKGKILQLQKEKQDEICKGMAQSLVNFVDRIINEDEASAAGAKSKTNKK